MPLPLLGIGDDLMSLSRYFYPTVVVLKLALCFVYIFRSLFLDRVTGYCNWFFLSLSVQLLGSYGTSIWYRRLLHSLV